MPITRVFKSGNSQAVRIPADIAYGDMSQDLTITRLGDVITVFPAGRSLKHAVNLLRQIPKPPKVEVREPLEMPERAGD